jgi:hypothetical protein
MGPTLTDGKLHTHTPKTALAFPTIILHKHNQLYKMENPTYLSSNKLYLTIQTMNSLHNICEIYVIVHTYGQKFFIIENLPT